MMYFGISNICHSHELDVHFCDGAGAGVVAAAAAAEKFSSGYYGVTNAGITVYCKGSTP